MEILAWALQIVLAVIFVGHSWMLLAARPDQIRGRSQWILEIPQALRRFAGAAEGLAAIALVLPWVTGVLPWLTPVAALGLVALMIGAIVTHATRGEQPNIVLNLILVALSAAVAYLRWPAVGLG